MSKIFFSYLFKTNLAAFRSAILDDDTEKICRILDIKRDYINKEIDNDGNTALLLAIQYASPLTVRLLLEQGACPDKPNGKTCYTPLAMIATKIYEDYNSYKAQRTLEMAKLLLDHGAYVDKPSLRTYLDENNKEYYGKETPLMTAVRKRNLPLTKLLIERKANVNSIERESQIRAIHLAVNNGDELIYDLLEKSGALISAVVTCGNNTLLHWFCYKKENDKNINLLNKLLDKGCYIDAQNHEQLTPLMIAVKYNMIETCRILLKNRAQIDKCDLNGNKAIDLTIPEGECSKLILQQENNQQIRLSRSNDTIIWRKPIDLKQKLSIESNETDKNLRNIEMTSSRRSRYSEEEEEEKKQIEMFSRPPIYPTQKRHSEEIDKKNENLWEKFLPTAPKRQIFKNLYKNRAQSTDGRSKW